MTDTARAFGFNDPGLRIPFSVAPSSFDTEMDRAQLALSSIGGFDVRLAPGATGTIAGTGDARRQRIVIRHDTDCMRAEGDTDRTRKGRKIDDREERSRLRAMAQAERPSGFA